MSEVSAHIDEWEITLMHRHGQWCAAAHSWLDDEHTDMYATAEQALVALVDMIGMPPQALVDLFDV